MFLSEAGSNLTPAYLSLDAPVSFRVPAAQRTCNGFPEMSEMIFDVSDESDREKKEPYHDFGSPK